MDRADERSKGPGLVVIEPPRERLRISLAYAPNADFVSQLIAERQRLPTQRQLRRVPIAEAVDAYTAGADRSVLRLPAGYRKSLRA